MLIRTGSSTDRDSRLSKPDSYADKYALGVAAIWIVFYAFIGVAAVVGHDVSSVAAALH